MKTNLVNRIALAWLLAFAATNLPAAQEQGLIATLQSSAGAPQKWAACQQLRISGSAQAVPALAALLTDERNSQAARHALEALPYPEAGAALRDALGKTTGMVKAGIIMSLGWRGEPAAAPLLTPLVKDADATIAIAAADALGRIGGQEAITALTAVRDTAPATVQPAIWEALLKCGERLFAAKDNAGAAAIYRGLLDSKFPPAVVAAAWRGVALADVAHRSELIVKALIGTDRLTQVAALKLVRELGDAHVIQECVREWAALAPDSQLAVLDAHMKFGAEAVPTARTASQSRDLAVRLAAWQALGELNDTDSIPALAKAAASGDRAERETARESLARLRGPGAREALLAQIGKAAISEKAELLRALGDRGDRAAVDVLLQNAAADAEPVRLAALESLSKLAPAEATAPLLDLAAKAKSDDQRDPVLKALYAICQASPNKEQTARSVVKAIGRFPKAERRQMLSLLAELATPDALAAAQAAARDQDLEMAKEAVRVLARWPSAQPALQLLEVARSSTDLTLQTLALRSAIEVTGQEADAAKRLALLQQAMALTKTPEEKKQVLGQIGQVPTREALEIALKDFANPELVNEAGQAAVSIAEKLAPANPKLGDEVAVKILAQVKEGELARRAWAMRLKPSSAASFIREWMVAGPYRQPGLTGAEAVFNVPFGPEKSGANVEWKAMPRADHASLYSIFPGQDNCVAYLRTRILAPEDCSGALLMGSDDGLKVWLNGEVVHQNNVDRGQVVDQDVAPIKLKKGANELLMKVTQGGGGWSACARIVGTDGKPIPGLMVELPTGAAQAVAASAPKPPPAPKPATLPKRDAFRKVRLSDQFYAEGAHYGDFNRDGKLDIVAGPFWFEGPDFQKRHEYRPVKAFDPKDYSDNFLTFAGDFNGDGWTDVLCVPFPGVEGFWYENPAGKEGAWKKHLAYPNIGNESPMWGDIDGDGRPELVFCNDGYLGYAGPNPARPGEPWVFQAVSTKDKRYQRFTHGVGFGDINGDKRVDLVEAVGWWEQPAELKPGQPWTFHPFHFADAAAQMLVTDVDGDGLADIITAWNCHLYGLVWWQQTKTGSSQPDWKKHVILTPTPDITTTDFRPSQMHALELVDMNGDGLKDILTGKRFWAHGPTGDKEPDAPAVVFWYELRRSRQGSPIFLPHLIDDDSGVGTQVATADLNNDQRPDVIVGNKKGIFVHLSEPAGAR